MSTPILYGPQFSYFVRVASLLLAYKGMPFRVSKAPFGEELAIFGEEHAKLHPFKKMPVLIAGDLVLPETMAIARYLEQEPGPSFMPGDKVQQAKIISVACMIHQYLHKVIVSNILLEFRFPKGEGGSVRFDVIRENIPLAETALTWVESQLHNRLHIVGEHFSLADAYLIPMLDYLFQIPDSWNPAKNRESLQRYVDYHQDQAYSKDVLI